MKEMQQEIKGKEVTLMKTAAPNLRAGEKLQVARSKFQESIDGNTESFMSHFCDSTLIIIPLLGVGPAGFAPFRY